MAFNFLCIFGPARALPTRLVQMLLFTALGAYQGRKGGGGRRRWGVNNIPLKEFFLYDAETFSSWLFSFHAEILMRELLVIISNPILTCRFFGQKFVCFLYFWDVPVN